MARVRSITLDGKEYQWYIKPYKKNPTHGRLLVVVEKLENGETKEQTILVMQRNIGPGVVKQKIKKYIGTNSNVKPVQQRRPRISKNSFILQNRQADGSTEPSRGFTGSVQSSILEPALSTGGYCSKGTA